MTSFAAYLKNYKNPSVIVLHNGPETNKYFANIAVNVLSSKGIHIYLNYGDNTSNSGICSYYMQKNLANFAIIFNSDRFDNKNTYCEIFAPGGLRLNKKELTDIVNSMVWTENIFTGTYLRDDNNVSFLADSYEIDFINELKYFQTFSTIPRNKKIIINISDRNNYEFIKKIFNELGYFVTNFLDINIITNNFIYNFQNIDKLVNDLNEFENELKEYGIILFLDDDLKYVKLIFQELNNKWTVLKDFELYYALVKFEILCNEITNNLDKSVKSNVCYTLLSPTIHQYKNKNKFENINYANVLMLLDFIKKTHKDIFLIFDEDGLLFTENNILNYNSGIINFIKVLDMWNYYLNQNTNIIEVSKIDYIGNDHYDYLHLDNYIYNEKAIKGLIDYFKQNKFVSISDFVVSDIEIFLDNNEYFVVKCYLNKRDLFNFCGFKIHKPTFKVSSYFSVLEKNEESLKNKIIFFKNSINKFFNKFS